MPDFDAMAHEAMAEATPLRPSQVDPDDRRARRSLGSRTLVRTVPGHGPPRDTKRACEGSPAGTVDRLGSGLAAPPFGPVPGGPARFSPTNTSRGDKATRRRRGRLPSRGSPCPSRSHVEAVRADGDRGCSIAEVDEVRRDGACANAAGDDGGVLEEPGAMRQVGQNGPSSAKFRMVSIRAWATADTRGSARQSPPARDTGSNCPRALSTTSTVSPPASILQAVEDGVDNARKTRVTLVAGLGEGDPGDRFTGGGGLQTCGEAPCPQDRPPPPGRRSEGGTVTPPPRVPLRRRARGGRRVRLRRRAPSPAVPPRRGEAGRPPKIVRVKTGPK